MDVGVPDSHERRVLDEGGIMIDFDPIRDAMWQARGDGFVLIWRALGPASSLTGGSGQFSF